MQIYINIKPILRLSGNTAEMTENQKSLKSPPDSPKNPNTFFHKTNHAKNRTTEHRSFIMRDILPFYLRWLQSHKKYRYTLFVKYS